MATKTSSITKTITKLYTCNSGSLSPIPNQLVPLPPPSLSLFSSFFSSSPAAASSVTESQSTITSQPPGESLSSLCVSCFWVRFNLPKDWSFTNYFGFFLLLFVFLERERSRWSKWLLFLPGAITFGLGTWQIVRRQEKVLFFSSSILLLVEIRGFAAQNRYKLQQISHLAILEIDFVTHIRLLQNCSCAYFW